VSVALLHGRPRWKIENDYKISVFFFVPHGARSSASTAARAGKISLATNPEAAASAASS